MSSVLYVRVDAASVDGDGLGEFVCGYVGEQNSDDKRLWHGNMKMDSEKYTRSLLVCIASDMRYNILSDSLHYPAASKMDVEYQDSPTMMGDDVQWMMVDAARSLAFPDEYLAFAKQRDDNDRKPVLPPQIDPYGYETSGR